MDLFSHIIEIKSPPVFLPLPTNLGLSNSEKVGFNVSVKSFINFNNKNFKNKFLNKKNPAFDFINREKFIELIKNVNNRKKFSKFIFNFINVSIFLKKNYDYK